MTSPPCFGVAAAPATAYAVFSHAAQLVLYTGVGALSLLLQGTSFRTLRAETARLPDAEPPNATP